MSRVPPVMRTGRRPDEYEPAESVSSPVVSGGGPTVEAILVMVLREAHALAATHVRLSGRVVVSTEDVCRAMKVIAHPDNAYIDTLGAPSRAEFETVYVAGSEEECSKCLDDMAMCGRMLATSVRINARGHLQLADAPDFADDKEDFLVAPEHVQRDNELMRHMASAHDRFAVSMTSAAYEALPAMRKAIIRAVACMDNHRDTRGHGKESNRGDQ